MSRNLRLIILPRNFVAGLIEGINFPKGKYDKNRPLIDLEKCNDVIIVDRNYFLKNESYIRMWAEMEENKELEKGQLSSVSQLGSLL